MQVEEELRVSQLAKIRGTFEIEIGDTRTSPDGFLDQSGLATLTRSEDRDDGEICETGVDLALERSGDVTLHFESLACNLRGYKQALSLLVFRPAPAGPGAAVVACYGRHAR